MDAMENQFPAAEGMDETENQFLATEGMAEFNLELEAQRQSADFQFHAEFVSAMQQQAEDRLKESLLGPPAVKPPTSRFSPEDRPKLPEPNSLLGRAVRETTLSPSSTQTLGEDDNKPVPRLFVPLKQWPAKDLKSLWKRLDVGCKLDEHILDDNTPGSEPPAENTSNPLDQNTVLMAYKNTPAPRGRTFSMYSTVAAILDGNTAPPKEDDHTSEGNTAPPVVEYHIPVTPRRVAFHLDDKEGCEIESHDVDE
ncbi:hypothetical protein FPQ18DRAFT_301947 [Pyronema domesticum]|nr:hypothetical protein FPQ18DRAFT_301947 [Pyronema domesticum]